VGDDDILTPRLVLSPLTPEDAPALLAYRADPVVARFQLFEPRTLDDALAFIAAASVADALWRSLGVRLRKSGKLAGDVGFRLVPEDASTAEIGVTIAPGHQRQGLAAEAVAALLGMLFEDLRVHRVYASVDPRNEASLRLFERIGMRREAHFRESLWFKGEWADDVVFAMLRREWEDRRGAPRG
jgi:RimJ/RimL family protein N-acetyltransferase